MLLHGSWIWFPWNYLSFVGASWSLTNGEQQQSKHKLPKELKGSKSCFVNDNHNSAGNTYIYNVNNYHVSINTYLLLYKWISNYIYNVLLYIHLVLFLHLSISFTLFVMHPLTSVDGLGVTFACWDSGGPFYQKFLLNQTTQNTSLCHIPKMVFQMFQ